MKKIVVRLKHRPLWGWAALLQRLFGASGSGADWRPVVSLLASRFDDERGVRLAQSLCPGPRVRGGQGTVLAPTVLRRDGFFLEIKDERYTARLVSKLSSQGIAIECEAELGDAWSEGALLASALGALARVSGTGAVVYIPEQERNLVGVALDEAQSLLVSSAEACERIQS